MTLNFFLVSVSFCAYAFLGWYVYRLAPKMQLNRRCAIVSLFASAWTLLFIIFFGSNEGNLVEAWYGSQLFSYLPKSLLLLHYVLHLTGYRKKLPTALLAAMYGFSLVAVILGLGYFASLPIGAWAYGILSRTGPGASPLRDAYAFISLAQYGFGFVLLFLWFRSSAFRRERRMALFHLIIGLIVVGSNSLLGLLPMRLGTLEIDSLLILQLAQPMALTFAIAHYNMLKPADFILSEYLYSQLSFSVTIIDHEGRIVSANAATKELSGLGSEELSGRSYEILLSENGSKRPRPDASGARFYECDFRSLGGGAITMSLSITPIRDKWGDCTGYVLIGQPIKRLLEKQRDLGLSNREREVCVLLMQGLSNQEIAERLFISSGTVKNHIYNIYDKTDVKNRVELSRLFN
jgi:PAS domain S-box-containing protein